jgi:hypothetical protein
MQEFTLILEVIKSVGFPGLIFFIWYLYHQAQVKTFEKLIEEQSKREERNFSLLQEMLETNQYHSTLLTKISEKMDSNQWCPLVKRSSKYNEY